MMDSACRSTNVGIACVLLFLFVAVPLRECIGLDNDIKYPLQAQNNVALNETASRNSAEVIEFACCNCGKTFLAFEDNICPECGWVKPALNYAKGLMPPAFIIAETGKKDISVVFKGFVILEGGNADNPDPKYWRLKIEWGNDAPAEIIPFGGSIHGYTFDRLEKIIDDNGIENWRLFAVRADSAIGLNMNIPVPVEDYYAAIQSDEIAENMQAFVAFEGSVLECKNSIYIILTIADDRILVSDIADNVFIIKMNR